MKVKGWLALGGCGESFLRTIEHDVGKRIAKCGIGFVCEIASDVGGLDPIASHTDFLSALSREEDNG